MRNQILNYIPEASTNYLIEILNKENIQILVKKERKTKHGDFRVLKNGKCQITINSNLNPYRFLITLIHEIAHYRVYKIFEKKVKPHGKEWKDIFKYMMLPLLNPKVFPNNLIPYISINLPKIPLHPSQNEDLILLITLEIQLMIFFQNF